jgi:predicted NAD/FAD-dependent oxidoreductase
LENGQVRYFAIGGMSALAKRLAAPLDVRLETKMERVEAVFAAGGPGIVAAERLVNAVRNCR